MGVAEMIRFWFAVFVFFYVGAFAKPMPHYQQLPLQNELSLTKFQTPATSFSGTGGSSTVDSVHLLDKTARNQITAGNASLARYVKVLSPAVNMCADTFGVRLTFYAKDKNQVMNLNSLEVWLSNSAGGSRRLEFGSFDIRDSGLTYWGDWATVWEPFKRFGVFGTFDCSAVDNVVVGLRAQTGAQDTITFGEIAVYPKQDSVATFIINEDDEWDGWRQYAIPTLQSFGWKHTMFINYGRLGQTNFTTKAQIDSLYTAGLLEPGNHLYIHDTASSLTIDSLKTSIVNNQQLICAAWECTPFLAWPFGAHSRADDSLVRSLGYFDFARLTKGNSFGEPQRIAPFAAKLALAFGNNTDTTAAKALIDTVIAYKSVGIFLFHQICNGCTPADGNTWRQDWFISTMNYLKTQVDAGRAQVLTLKQYTSRYGGLRSSTLRAGGRR
jgi:hypothetical protein